MYIISTDSVGVWGLTSKSEAKILWRSLPKGAQQRIRIVPNSGKEQAAQHAGGTPEDLDDPQPPQNATQHQAHTQPQPQPTSQQR